MKKSLLEILLNTSKRELLTHPQLTCFPHWTYLVDNNEIISIGINRAHEPPRWMGYHRQNGTFKPKWHSEADAIHRLRHHIDSFIAVNIRLNRKGEPRMSMPCQCCYKLLQANRCKRIYFTTSSTWGIL